MSATITRGTTYGASESITNTKLHLLVDGASISGISNSEIASNAAIAYSKLNLALSIADADVSTSAAISYSKLSLSAHITRTDIATGYGLVPTGGIIMWSGTIATIPTGWYLCDGNNSTPNLTNRFVVCANADSGGVAKSTITGSALQSSDTGVMPAHTHTHNGIVEATGALKSGTSSGNTTDGVTGSTGTGTKVIAVFYALAYIMKS